MDFSAYLQRLYDYNYWANHRILKTAEALTDEQRDRVQGHSWGSVHAVLLHVMNAEWIWLSRWKGESPSEFPTAQDYPTVPALKKRWADLEAEMRAFVAEQTDQSLQREVVYTNMAGKTYRLILWQMMVHVPNHGTHHRGELAAMFAALQVSHPEDDWLHYFLELSAQRSA